MPFPRGKYHTSVKPGHRYGKWTVVERSGQDRFRRPTFKLRCDCGSEVVARWKQSKSCGCVRSAKLRIVNTGKRKAYGESSFNQLYRAYRNKAYKRGIEFSLSKDEFRELVNKPCYYCCLPPSGIMSGYGYYGEYVYSGIDRVDSQNGYVIGNVVPCCKFCNPAKGSLSRQEFFEWASRVVSHMAANGFELHGVFNG